MKGASVAWLLPVGITAIFAAWFVWSLPTTPRESSADWVAPLGVNPLGDDAQEYIRIAESVRTDGAYAYNGEPTRVRPPLYPLFLAAIQGAAGHHYLRYAQALQALFITMAVAVFYFIVRRVHGPRAGLVAAVVLGLFVPFAVRSALVMSEALFMLLLLLFLFWTLKALEEGRRRDYVLAGLAVGLAALARPAPILFPLVLVPLLLQFTRHSGAGRERLVSIGLFVAAFGVVLAPWGIRNAVTLGEFTVLPSSGGVNLWAASHQDWREFVGQHMAYALQLPEFHAIVGDDYYIDSEANERFRKVGLENIKADPFGWFGRNAAKLAFVAYESFPQELLLAMEVRKTVTGNPTWARLVHAGTMLFIVLTVAGGLLTWRLLGVRLALAVLLYFYAIEFVSFAEPRHLLPIVPLYLLLAAPTLLRLGRWAAPRPQRSQ